VLSRLTGSLPRLAALAGAATVLAACSSGGGAPSPGASTSASALSARQTIRLAADKAQRVTSFSGTMGITLNMAAQGTVTMTGIVAEQLSPSLKAEINFTTLEGGGQSLPGGLDEIVTRDAVYIKMSMLAQSLHTSKPWIELPLSQLGKLSGTDLNSLFNQAQASNPLAQTQMLTASPDVHKVGTGVVGGVPVTEYAGTYSIAKGLASLPANLRKSLSSQIASLGIKSGRFHVWIDGQDQVRKIILNLTASKLTETVSETITSVNQPVTITLPGPGETYTIPASALSSTPAI
jgi:hypothetical protein